MKPARSHLAVVLDTADEYDNRPIVTPVSKPCAACGGQVILRRAGMTYCCDQAELTALRALAKEIDQRLLCELEDPPTDPHASNVLAWLRQRVVSVRRLDLPKLPS